MLAQVRADPSVIYERAKVIFFAFSVVGGFVDHKIELDGVHPGDSHFIGAIEGFRFAELKLNVLGCGQHWGGDRWAGIGRGWGLQ